MMQFLSDPDDMKWLSDVHGVPRDMKSAIIVGNEDSPTQIEAWRDEDPDCNAPPDWSMGGQQP